MIEAVLSGLSKKAEAFPDRRDDRARDSASNLAERDRGCVTTRRGGQCVAHRWHFSDRGRGRVAGWPGEG